MWYGIWMSLGFVGSGFVLGVVWNMDGEFFLVGGWVCAVGGGGKRLFLLLLRIERDEKDEKEGKEEKGKEKDD